MAFFLTGSRPINSTEGPSNNPSTTTIIAELNSSQFAPNPKQLTRVYGMNFWLGGSTGGYWAIEQATSTAISSAVIVDAFYPRTASGQTSQFVRKFTMGPTDRIRCRLVSSATALYEASIQAEELA